MISRSRSGRSLSEASRVATSALQSGMILLRNPLDRVNEFGPVAALRRQHAAAFGCQPVEPAPALVRLLDPLAGDPAALLEAVEQRIERRHLELQPAARALLDQLADLVAVTRACFHQRQDQQLGAAF